jgi:hypothetical protein
MASTIIFITVIDSIISFALDIARRLWRVVNFVFAVADAPYLTPQKRQRLSITGYGQRTRQKYKIKTWFVVALVAGHFSQKLAVNVNA